MASGGGGRIGPRASRTVISAKYATPISTDTMPVTIATQRPRCCFGAAIRADPPRIDSKLMQVDPADHDRYAGCQEQP